VTNKIPATPVCCSPAASRAGWAAATSRCAGSRRTILERVIARLQPHATASFSTPMAIRALRGVRPAVIADSVADFPGPLAGILAALDWTAANRPEVQWILSAAADCPFLPATRRAPASSSRDENAQLAVAASDGQSHPVIGLWSVALREELRHALVVEDIRKIDRWTARYRLATVTWPTTLLDPFFQCEHDGYIAEAERLAELDGG